jgi:hypothetical protein
MELVSQSVSYISCKSVLTFKVCYHVIHSIFTTSLWATRESPGNSQSGRKFWCLYITSWRHKWWGCISKNKTEYSSCWELLCCLKESFPHSKALPWQSKDFPECHQVDNVTMTNYCFSLRCHVLWSPEKGVLSLTIFWTTVCYTLLRHMTI